MPQAKPNLSPSKPGHRLAWLAALLLGLGQWNLFSGRVVLGLGLSMFATGLLALDLLLPQSIKLPSLAKLAKAEKPGKGKALPLALPAAPLNLNDLLAKGQALLARVQLPWDELSFNRAWLLLPAGLLLMMAQWKLSQGKIVMPIVALVGGALVISVFVQGLGRRLLLPHINQNLKSLVLMAMGFPLQLLGASMLWRYQSVMWGFCWISLGGFWSLYALYRWPMNLQYVEEPSTNFGSEGSDEWLYAAPRPFFNWAVWTRKLWYIIGAMICAYLATSVFSASREGWSVTMGFLSIFLLLLSFPWLPGTLAETLNTGPRVRASLGLALIAVALFLGYRGQALLQSGAIGKGLWRFMIAGILAVLAVGPRPLSKRERADEPKPVRWAEITLFLSLVALALALRVWRVGDFPYAAEGDESGGGIYGTDILNGRVENHLISGNVPLHFFSVTSVFFKFFGISVGTLRAHSVIMGTLSIGAAYIFFRLLAGWAASTLATLLLVTAYWHLHYSRFGHYNIDQVFMQTVAFYFIFKGLREKSTALCAVGGLSFGMAMLPHLASRLLPFQGIVFLGYLFLSGRASLRRHATGLIAFVLGAWIMASPGLMYWFRATGASFGRTSSVSIFDKTNTNAPRDVLAGFVHNSKVSMLMFNHVGDNRPRDNPVAPDKILEAGMAVLFAIAFAYSLVHWRQPMRFFLLGAFFINLSASVLSVEAPQTLRTAGNIPIVIAFIAVWLGDISWTLSGFGRRLGLSLFMAAMLPLVLLMSWRSARIYFVDRAGQAFDVGPTLVGKLAGDIQAEVNRPVKGIFAATGFVAPHLPVVLFKRKAEMASYFNLAEFLPPIEPAGDLVLMLVDEYQECAPILQSVFPSEPLGAIKNDSRVPGPDFARYIHVKAETLAKLRGLRAFARVGGAERKVENAPLSTQFEGLEGATQIRWKGALVLRNFGYYRFSSKGPGVFRVRVDGAAGGPNQDVALAMGAHNIEVDWSGPAGSAADLLWQRRPVTPGVVFSASITGPEPVPVQHLWMDYKPRGFYGRYWTGMEFKGQLMTETIEPTLFARWLDSPIQGRWCAKWKGRFKPPQAGSYRFNMPVVGACEVRVNGRLMYRNGLHLNPDKPLEVAQPSIQLSGDSALIEVRYSTDGNPWIDLRWSGPGFDNRIFQEPSLEPVKD